MFDKIKTWWRTINHKCVPMKYDETGETIIFYWDVPWCFCQKFTVCSICEKVKVLSKITADNRPPIGIGYRKEEDGKLWSGSCDFAKVDSIGRDVLRVSRKKQIPGV